MNEGAREDDDDEEDEDDGEEDEYGEETMNDNALEGGKQTKHANEGEARGKEEEEEETSAKAYLESCVTTHVYDAMCALNASRPSDALEFLAVFFAQRAREVREGMDDGRGR